jgi:HrpA-like RNA helicase
MVKEPSFDPDKNMTTLDVKLVSQSSAKQRAGRAGIVSIVFYIIFS